MKKLLNQLVDEIEQMNVLKSKLSPIDRHYLNLVKTELVLVESLEKISDSYLDYVTTVERDINNREEIESYFKKDSITDAEEFVTGRVNSGGTAYVYNGKNIKEALLKDDYGIPIGAVAIDQDTVKIEFSINKLPKQKEYCSKDCTDEEDVNKTDILEG